MDYKESEVRRIPTKINGLDRLLYGGLDFMKKPFTIVIRGGAGTESTLFGLQMLYGIALSLNEKEHLPIFPKSISPTFLTSCHNPMDINKVVVDTYISSCILALTKKHIQKSYK